jgi:DNA-binding phage protein
LEYELIDQIMVAIRRSGMSDFAVAMKAHVHPATLRSWRDKAVVGPRLTTIAKVAHALSVRISVENQRVRLEPVGALQAKQPSVKRMRPFLWRMR